MFVWLLPVWVSHCDNVLWCDCTLTVDLTDTAARNKSVVAPEVCSVEFIYPDDQGYSPDQVNVCDTPACADTYTYMHTLQTYYMHVFVCLVCITCVSFV